MVEISHVALEEEAYYNAASPCYTLAVQNRGLDLLAGLSTVGAVILCVPSPASAYVDPGVGTMLWQLAAAALLGSLFYARRAVSWIRARFARAERDRNSSPVGE
jgi:hypothetical protein